MFIVHTFRIPLIRYSLLPSLSRKAVFDVIVYDVLLSNECGWEYCVEAFPILPFIDREGDALF